MSNKKSNKHQLPFSNEIKLMKDDFKKMIDEMPDADFIDMISFLMFASDDFEDDWAEDEGWEDEAEKFYNQEKNNISNFPINDDNLPF